MLNRLWTGTVALLTVSMLAGCANSRFSRDQYASLPADPFLTADAASLVPPVADRQVITADATSTSGEEFVQVNSESGARGAASAVVAPESSTPDFSAAPPVADSLATADHSFGEPSKRDRANQATDEAGRGFDAWLQKNDGQVSQASAEFEQDLHASRESMSRRVQQAGFSEFPGERPRFDDLVESSGQKPADENPFAAMDESSTASADGANDLSFDDEDAWTPPAGFEF